MAAKKKASQAPTTFDELAAAPSDERIRPRRMTGMQSERRIQELQDQVARLKAMVEEIQGPGVEWHRLIGSHADAPDVFEDAARIGREWRESFRPKPRGTKPNSPSPRLR